MEKYKEATKDFTIADQIDPSLGGANKCKSIIEYVQKTYNLIAKKAFQKPARIQGMSKTLQKNIIPEKIQDQTKDKKQILFDSMKYGLNENSYLHFKVLRQLEKEGEIPVCFIIMDEKTNCSCISIYNTNISIKKDMEEDADGIIINPFLNSVEAMIEEKIVSYPSIMVTNLSHLFINGVSMNIKFSKSILTHNTFT